MSRWFYIERRLVSETLSWDIAHHLYVRILEGKAVIVTDNPAVLLAAVRKQWLKLARQVQNVRAGTTNAILISEVTYQIVQMQHARFVANTPWEEPDGNVYFASAGKLLDAPPMCRTLYITGQLDDTTLEALTRAMPKRSLVVLY